MGQCMPNDKATKISSQLSELLAAVDSQVRSRATILQVQNRVSSSRVRALDHRRCFLDATAAETTCSLRASEFTLLEAAHTNIMIARDTMQTSRC